MVERRSPKPLMWVRLLLPLPYENKANSIYCFVGGFAINILIKKVSK